MMPSSFRFVIKKKTKLQDLGIFLCLQKNIKMFFKTFACPCQTPIGQAALGSRALVAHKNPSAIAISGALCLVWKQDEIFLDFFAGVAGWGAQGVVHSLWNFSYGTRDGTGPLAVRAWSPNHWLAGEFPFVILKAYISQSGTSITI